MKKLRIVSRKSRLALRQSEIVKDRLQIAYPQLEIEIIGISTSGDEILETPLNLIGGKGLFITELEKYLLEDKADIAVHSMKDMPAVITEGLQIGAVLKRADPRDVLVSNKYTSIRELPPGSIIGTSSLRRQAQVLAINSQLQVEPLRGNVDTRLQKLHAGKYAAIILAAAGLERLKITECLQTPIAMHDMWPAVGQGIIGIEYRSDKLKLKHLLAPINDHETAICLQAERALNTLLNGGCQAPIAGFAALKDGVVTLHGFVADPSGKQILTDTQTAPPNAAADLGVRVAQQLINAGALDIIARAKQESQKNSW